MRTLHCLPALLLAGLTGCAALQATPPTAVHQPMSVRPDARAAQASGSGSIYQPSFTRPLFEDRRARFVGDIITVNLVEQTAASKKSSANAERNASLAASITALAKLPLGGLNGLDATASDASKFGGKGDAAANNAFTGTITTTVIEVLPNGNLLVSGEKQIAIFDVLVTAYKNGSPIVKTSDAMASSESFSPSTAFRRDQWATIKGVYLDLAPGVKRGAWMLLV